jgi:hypothetical protein
VTQKTNNGIQKNRHLRPPHYRRTSTALPRHLDPHRRRPGPRRPAQNPRTSRQGHAVSDAGLRTGRGSDPAVGHVQRRLPRNGDRARHRIVLHVRTPHVAFFWQSPHRVHPEWLHRGPEQNPARGRCVCPSPTSARAAHPRGARRAPKHPPAARRSGGHRGQSHVHDDAGGTKAGVANHHVGIHRCVSRRPQDPQRISPPHRHPVAADHTSCPC